MNKETKTLIRNAVFLIAIILFFLILDKIGFKNIYSTLKTTNPMFLFLSVASLFVSYIMWSFKWKTLLNGVVKVKFKDVFLNILSTEFVNNLTPGVSVGGEPLRAYYIAEEYKKPSTKIFTTVIIEKVINALIVISLVILAILFSVLFVEINWVVKLISSIIGILILLFILFFILKKADVLKKLKIKIKNTQFAKFIKGKKVYKKLRGGIAKTFGYFVYSFKNLRKEKKILARVIIFGLLKWVFKILAVYFLVLSLNYNISPLIIVIVVIIAGLLGDVAFVPNVGVTEVSMIALYVAFGVPGAVAALATVFYRLIYYMYALGFGAVSWNYLHSKY